MPKCLLRLITKGNQSVLSIKKGSVYLKRNMLISCTVIRRQNEQFSFWYLVRSQPQKEVMFCTVAP